MAEAGAGLVPDDEPMRNSGFPLLKGEFFVRFLFGAVVGAGSGFYAALRRGGDRSLLELVLWTGSGLVIFGLAAAYGGDAFWRRL